MADSTGKVGRRQYIDEFHRFCRGSSVRFSKAKPSADDR